MGSAHHAEPPAWAVFLTPWRFPGSYIIERELANRAIKLGYYKPCPVRRYVVREEGDADYGFVRAAVENETIHRTRAPTCAELLQSALDRGLLSPSSPTPNSQSG